MASAGGKTHPARQRGQSLVLGSLLLMVVMVVLLLMFNSAQLTSTKMQLQNTADATAYSVATVAARDYNFSAYMNRAMVANQVAAAQMVGLTSWFRFTGQTLDNIAVACAPFPAVDAICAAIATTYKEYETIFEKSVLPVLMKTLNYWMVALSDLQMAFHWGNVEAIAQNVLYRGDTLQTGVLARNDPDARVLSWPDASLIPWPDKSGDIPAELYRLMILTKDAAQWWNYTKRYDESKKDDMSRFADVTRRSLDDFSNSRSWPDVDGNDPSVTIHDTAWVIEKILPFIHIPKWLEDAIKAALPISASVTLGVARRGGTELKQVEGHYSWSAADTLMGTAKVTVTVEFDITYPCGCNKWWGPICTDIKYCTAKTSKDFRSPTIYIPFGWGAAYSTAADDKTAGPTIFDSGLDGKQYGGAADGMKEITFGLAVGTYGDIPITSFGGIKPYYDIADTSAKNREGPEFTFVVSKRTDKNRTAARAGFGAPEKAAGPFGLDNLRLEEPADPDSFYAIAKGKLHFAQSDQYSNLFSPYWEAKLADTSNTERELAFETLFGWKDFLHGTPSAPQPSGLSSYEH